MRSSSSNPQVTSVVSVGSNLGDRLLNLQRAIDLLGTLSLVRVADLSPVYECEPIDCPVGSAWFLNFIVKCETSMSPFDFLRQCLEIEQTIGRIRKGIPNEPRTLDVDIITFGNEMIADPPLLLVPHPRAHMRPFVLLPWLDIDPAAKLPGKGEVSALVAHSSPQIVRRRSDLHLARPRS